MNAPHGRHPGYMPYPGPAAVQVAGFRRGRALPIVVASGLAMGVFAGLIIVRGTGEAAAEKAGGGEAAEAAAAAETAPAAATGSAPAAASETAPAAASETARGTETAAATASETGSATATETATASATASETAPGTGSATEAGGASESAAGAGAAPAIPEAGAGAAPAIPEATATLTFDVDPDDAVVRVDGVKVTGGAHQVPLEGGKARVRVQISARGYRTYSKTLTVTEDRELEVELRRPSRKTGGKKPAGPGGLIQL